MKEHPIIFSTPMAQALLNTKPGSWPTEPIDPSKPFKSMTRRAVKPHYKLLKEGPKYRTGDIFWVRETWANIDNNYIYLADYPEGLYPCKMRPSIHLPREAARLFLEVKKVRMERIREIMPEDKKREGFSDCHRAYPCAEYNECNTPCFMKTWDTLNAKRGYSWGRNPLVWVYEFMRIK